MTSVPAAEALTQAPADAPRERKGREARRATRLAKGAVSIPYIVRNLPLTNVLSEEGLATIEANAERLLEDIGIDFRGYPTALKLFKHAGCDVKGERVRFPRGLA